MGGLSTRQFLGRSQVMTSVGTVGVHWRVCIMSRLEPQACNKFLLDPQSTLQTVAYDNDYEFNANFTESRRDMGLCACL